MKDAARISIGSKKGKIQFNQRNDFQAIKTLLQMAQASQEEERVYGIGIAPAWEGWDPSLSGWLNWMISLILSNSKNVCKNELMISIIAVAQAIINVHNGIPFSSNKDNISNTL